MRSFAKARHACSILFAAGLVVLLANGPAPAQTWSGQVVDATTGQPVSGAHVTPQGTARAVTGADGRFNITYTDVEWKGQLGSDRARSGIWLLDVQVPPPPGENRRDYWHARLIRSTAGQVGVVRSMPRWVYVRGRVLSAEDGKPLAKVLVTLGRRNPGDSDARFHSGAAARTDADGNFVFDPLPGFVKDGGGSARTWVDAEKAVEAAARKAFSEGYVTYDYGPMWDFAVVSIGYDKGYYPIPRDRVVTSADERIHTYVVIRHPAKDKPPHANPITAEQRGLPGKPPAEPVPGDPPATDPGPVDPPATHPPVARMTLRADSRKAKTGETVTVPLWLLKGAGLIDLNFNVEYDPAVVQPVGSVVRGNLLPGADFEANTAKRGVVQLGLVPKAGGVGAADGTLAQVSFRAVGKPGTRSALRIVPRKGTVAGGAAANPATIHGEIQIVGDDGFIPGDINGDGKIDMADVLMALKISVELLPHNPRADVDGDGQVTAADARLIREMVLGRRN